MIGYDLEKDCLTLKYLGDKVHKMPEVEIKDQIHQNDMRECSTSKINRVSWFVIHRN